MVSAKFPENRFRIDGEIAENHAILVNLTASITANNSFYVKSSTFAIIKHFLARCVIILAFLSVLKFSVTLLINNNVQITVHVYATLYILILSPTMEHVCLEISKEMHLGYCLKDEQVNAISALCSGENVFAILPTGYGKSDIFGLYPKIKQKVICSLH